MLSSLSDLCFSFKQKNNVGNAASQAQFYCWHRPISFKYEYTTETFY